MKNRRMIVLIGAAALMLCTSIAMAKPHGPPNGKGLLNSTRIEIMAEKLNVDEAVVTKIKNIVYESQAAAIDKKANLQKARLKLKRLMDQVTPDRKAVMAALDRVGQLQTEMRKHRVGMLLDVSALLTPEQRKGFKRLMRRPGKKRRKGMRGPRGHRGPRGNP